MYFPPEYAPVNAVQLTWPNADTDWGYMLSEVLETYNNLLEALLANEQLPVVIVVTRDIAETEASFTKPTLKNNPKIHYVVCPINDTWARDHSPLMIFENKDSKEAVLTKFQFNGWGLKFASNFDNMIGVEVNRQFFSGQNYVKYDDSLWGITLEGGAIDSDGEGSLLTTSSCLLSPHRNGIKDKEFYNSLFRQHFGITNVLWLDHGGLAGDDTDGHVDTLARFAPNNTIVYVGTPTDRSNPDYEELRLMGEEIKQLKNAKGEPYSLIELPCTSIIRDEEGNQIPATYANYLICNKYVYVPVYKVEQDTAALEQIAKAYPGYTVTPIDCRSLIKQHGSLHCITMQYTFNV